MGASHTSASDRKFADSDTPIPDTFSGSERQVYGGLGHGSKWQELADYPPPHDSVKQTSKLEFSGNELLDFNAVGVKNAILNCDYTDWLAEQPG